MKKIRSKHFCVRKRDLDTIIKTLLSRLQRLQVVFLLLLLKVSKTTFKTIKKLGIVGSYCRTELIFKTKHL